MTTARNPFGTDLAAPSGLDPSLAAGLDILADMDGSAGDPGELTGGQINTLQVLFSDRSGFGLYCFAFYICGAQDMYYPLHGDMCRFLSRWGQLELANPDGSTRIEYRPEAEGDTVVDNWRRLHLCVPRDHFKTTLATRANGLWTILQDPELTLGIWNENEKKAKSWVAATKAVIENNRLLHQIWPSALPPGIHFRDREAGKTVPRNWKWGDTGLLLNRSSHMVAELSMEPFGVGGASAGKHFTHVIKDDIIGDKASKSEAEMQSANDWLDTSYSLERPANNGCELLNYTRWGHFDTYRHQLSQREGQYKVYLRHMLEGPNGEPDVVNGKVIFPTRFTSAGARQMYHEDPFNFMSQQMCIPMAGKSTSFQHSWIRYGEIAGSVDPEYGDLRHFAIEKRSYDPAVMHGDVLEYEVAAPRVVPLREMAIAVLLDPAPSKRSEIRREPRARNGIIVVGKDAYGRNYLLDSLALREDSVTVMHAVVDKAIEWGTSTIGIEEVNFSSIYAELWHALIQYRYPDFTPEWLSLLTGGVSKEERIQTLQAPIRSGLWYFAHGPAEYAVQEVIEYPHSETKDLIDVMAYVDRYIPRPTTFNEDEMFLDQSSRIDAGRSVATGY